MYQFFESIKLENGILLNLNYHQERLNNTYYDNYNKTSNFDLNILLIVPKEYNDGVYKCRFSYDSDKCKIDFEPYTKKRIESLQLVVADSIDYKHKYTNREQFKELLEQKKNCDDILIVKDGQITETSFCNIAFFDGINWFTPETYLLNGTCRKRLLYENRIKIKQITPSDLKNYESFCLFNALRGEELNEKIPISNIIL